MNLKDIPPFFLLIGLQTFSLILILKIRLRSFIMPAPTTHGFAEKVALIINGHEGIGRAVALQLALSGCYVILSYPGSYGSQANILNELTSLGTLANAFEFVDAKSAIEEVEKLYGRLDLIVNCLEYDQDSVYLINTIIEEGAKLMQSRPKPTIVTVITRKVVEDMTVLTQQTQEFSSTLLSHFRVNLIIAEKSESFQEYGLFETKTGVQNDDVARVVTFLLSSEAKALNGQVLFAR